jgi:ribosomal protein S18 acetylase RimI-like enzyme
VTARFTIEPLGAGQGRKAFASGTAPLDRYLHEIATQDIKRRLSNCFVARDEHGTIAGYYTFAAGSVPLLELPESETKRLPRYGVLPAGLIGRLAVDHNFRGQGLGSMLVIDAARRASAAETAIFALIVDAKDEQAAGFYRHLGFHIFASRSLSLYIPVATVLAALAAARPP